MSIKSRVKINTFLQVTLSSTLLVTGISAQANAGGYLIQEQSTLHQGNAFSGIVSEPKDASTIFFNPAGLTALHEPQIVAGTSVVSVKLDFNDTGSTVTTPGSGGSIASGGGEGGNPFDPVPVPNVAMTIPLNEDIWVGLSINSPFGLANDYGHDWVGRYDSTRSELITLDVAPTVAYRVTDKFSIGGGVDIQYAKATLKSAIPDPAVALPSAATDGLASLDGTDWSVGYNLGLLYNATNDLRFGLHYRSGVDHELDGRVLQELPAGAGGATLNRPAVADLNLPQILSMGASYDIDDKWTVMSRVSRTGWSSFNEIRVRFDAGGADSVTTQNYKNTYTFALGAEYNWNENWTLRAGFQYDETPTVDAFRTSRTPDADRYWLSGGFTYNLGPNMSLDFAYSHIFMDDEEITLTRPFAALGSTSNVTGKIEGSLDIASMSLKYSF